jgi:3-dehydroquinate synthase
MNTTPMKGIRVNLGCSSYPVFIGSGTLQHCPVWLRQQRLETPVFLVTNPTVFDLYGHAFKESLQNAGLETQVLMVPDGESYKSLDTAIKLYSELNQHKAGRHTPLLALGGGVIGDLAGFVAATYMRGMPLIHLPTTLVAQVDSSIGGKTAVNNATIKNQIGTFYQPRAVISDTDTLRSLARRDISNGLAEIIKSAVIRDASLFRFLENNMHSLKSGDSRALNHVILRTASIKAAIVARDEHDLGIRNILNFGHTIGHGIEAATRFQVNHGEAVALGMLAAARISRQLGMFPPSDFSRLQNLICQAGLPLTMPEIDINAIMEAITHDKKISGGKIRFILPLKIGRAAISDRVDTAMIAAALSAT